MEVRLQTSISASNLCHNYVPFVRHTEAAAQLGKLRAQTDFFANALIIRCHDRPWAGVVRARSRAGISGRDRRGYAKRQSRSASPSEARLSRPQPATSCPSQCGRFWLSQAVPRSCSACQKSPDARQARRSLGDRKAIEYWAVLLKTNFEFNGRCV